MICEDSSISPSFFIWRSSPSMIAHWRFVFVPCVWDFYSKLSNSAKNNRFWPLLILKNRVLSSFIPFPTFIRHGCCREYYPVGLWFAQVWQTVGKQIQQCNYSQVKIQFNLKKLLQKVSQLILVGFSVLFNILKRYQSRNPGKVFFFQDGVQDGRRNVLVIIIYYVTINSNLMILVSISRFWGAKNTLRSLKNDVGLLRNSKKDKFGYHWAV